MAPTNPTAVLSPAALARCRTPQVADEQAADLMRGTSAHPAAGYWEGSAQLVLRCYLLAAALSGADADQVVAWAEHPEDPAARQVLTRHSAHVPPDWPGLLETVLTSSREERVTVFATLWHALRPDARP